MQLFFAMVYGSKLSQHKKDQDKEIEQKRITSQRIDGFSPVKYVISYDDENNGNTVHLYTDELVKENQPEVEEFEKIVSAGAVILAIKNMDEDTLNYKMDDCSAQIFRTGDQDNYEIRFYIKGHDPFIIQ